jgi:large subunit ribosomal protein L13
VQKSYYPKLNEINREWVLVDANDEILGRVASWVASVLLGKDKPEFTPGVNIGSLVVVINAERIQVTGTKLDSKIYYRHSGYPGGLSQISLRDQLKKHPERVIKQAVWGMLPHNKYGRSLMTRIRIYAGPEHPHQAQTPEHLT